MKICYVPKTFHKKSVALIEQANEILEDYEAQGFTLTLRQLYYQFVARDLLPNTQKSYDNLGVLINDARLAGLVDWDAIEDRTRFLRRHSFWHSPKQIIQSAADSYRRNVWNPQSTHFEVWIEKDALVGIIEPICNEWRVPYYACRGYNSQSEHWSAAQRIKVNKRQGHDTVILHLGDHDPSGIDMSRDLQDRFEMFEAYCEVRRIALNMNQVRQYSPPPNPAKLSDSRAQWSANAFGYIGQFGDESWELDALEPSAIAGLIRAEIENTIDHDAWAEELRIEEEQREKLQEVADNFED